LKLYEIADEIELILSRDVDRDTGEITDETLAKLESLEMARDAKALAVAAYLKGELAEAEAVRVEAYKLQKRAEGHANRAKRLVEYLGQNIPSDAAPIADARSRIAWRTNPPKVVIDDPEAVPAEYRRVIPERSEPDKAALKSALKSRKLPFARLVQELRLEVK